jgi:hypothetical protein
MNRNSYRGIYTELHTPMQLELATGRSFRFNRSTIGEAIGAFWHREQIRAYHLTRAKIESEEYENTLASQGPANYLVAHFATAYNPLPSPSRNRGPACVCARIFCDLDLLADPWQRCSFHLF